MPRQSRGRSTSTSRSAPTKPAAAPAQTRSATTAAAPAGGYQTPAAPAPPATGAASQGPGILGQIASTAAGVAIGSTVGHGLSNVLFGSGDKAAAAEQAAPAAAQQGQGVMSCEQPAKDFTLCLEKADMQSCTWYLEQLKACQAAAKPY
ncbi:Chch domain protein [Mycena indigotica]|uniref:Chch domain protein n=1 Tax=Mycena indigotica TaxID=2126181 RepID=A0A8H6TF28_9AGAR|nr:Chch domain protein [Mycena indigotica]KAF7316191.1 Chch domain protein [Mycena indigotica]